MSPYPPEARERTKLLRQALSRWDNEGGAAPGHAGFAAGDAPPTTATPFPLTNAELVQLQIRVIALENLILALLARASDEELALMQDIATSITPRPGFTPHRLTIHAKAQMEHLVQRSQSLNETPPL